MTAHVGDKLRLVGGLRYTHDHKDFAGGLDRLVVLCARVVNGVPSCPNAPLVPFSFGADAQNTVPVPPLSGGPGPSIVPIGMTGALAVRLPLFALDDHLSNGRLTYRGAVEYDLAPRSLAYASVETGYRSGGFSLAQGFDSYQPEYITAWTIGSKNRFLDNRLELNVELFYWRYRNQQVSHFGLDLSGQNANFIQNIGRSTNKGAEVEGRVLATGTIELSANVQYLDAKYNSYVYQTPISGGPPFTGCVVTPTATNPSLGNVDCSGKDAYNAPKWTINVAAQQTVHLGALKLVGSVSTQYLGRRYISFGFTPDELAKATWQTGLNLALSREGSAWELSAYALNLGNDRYAVNATQNPLTGLTATSHAAPLQVGGPIAYKF